MTSGYSISIEPPRPRIAEMKWPPDAKTSGSNQCGTDKLTLKTQVGMLEGLGYATRLSKYRMYTVVVYDCMLSLVRVQVDGGRLDHIITLPLLLLPSSIPEPCACLALQSSRSTDRTVGLFSHLDLLPHPLLCCPHPT